MSTTLAESAGDTPRAPLVPGTQGAPPECAAHPLRREFWEHRYLWLGPGRDGCACSPLCALSLAARISARTGHVGEQLPRATREQRVAIGSIVQWALSVPLYIVLGLLVSYYTLDCLFAERKDRSILFWKSLPVSDGLTVFSKLFVALVVAPLLVFVLAIATYLVFDAIVSVRIAAHNLPDVIAWSTPTVAAHRSGDAADAGTGRAVVRTGGCRSHAGLGLGAPLAVPVGDAAAPLLAPILERIALGTHYIWNYYNYRTWGIWATLVAGYRFRIVTHEGVAPVSTLLSDLQFRAAFTTAGLWLGARWPPPPSSTSPCAARRYRDDT